MMNDPLRCKPHKGFAAASTLPFSTSVNSRNDLLPGIVFAGIVRVKVVS
ncbi:MAG: hypothetical protein LBT25_05855 [Candidatus Symbiothrix sp.]|jgi:hypothetical protein|nr:hypothetical protein [Candidatus Symbiothrix sp.]